MVICKNSLTCKFNLECGGAKPHDHCNECGKCPFDKSTDCIEYLNPVDIRIDTFTNSGSIIEMIMIHIPTGAWVKDKGNKYTTIKNNLHIKLSTIVEKLKTDTTANIIKHTFAKDVREWFAFYGGEELGISLEHASLVWDASKKATTFHAVELEEKQHGAICVGCLMDGCNKKESSRCKTCSRFYEDNYQPK